MSLPIEIDKIIIRKRQRNLDKARVKALAESIHEVGLINPILINCRTLISGAHRLAACKLLGWDRIPYSVVGINGDDDHNILIEIHENLFQNRLSDDEREKLMATRREILSRRK